MKITSYSREEAERLQLLPEAFFNEQFNRVFVARENGETIAHAALCCYYQSWCLRLCKVQPAHRGRGIQRKLIRARLAWLKARQAKWCNVWVKPTNVYSFNNLIEEGFRLIPELPRNFEDAPHIKLRKIL